MQENAVGSIHGNPELINDPLTVREATLGFQQTSGRKLFSTEVKVYATSSACPAILDKNDESMKPVEYVEGRKDITPALVDLFVICCSPENGK